MQLLFADDNRLQAHGPAKFDDILLAIFLWCLAGTPLSWHKCRGGLSCEWIGYWLDYSRFQLGISEGRSTWLIKWGDRIVKEGLVQMRDFAEGLGRLGFCAGVLEFHRPFLSALYAWSAAAPLGAVLPVPPLVRLTLSWIMDQFRTGRRTTCCRKPAKDLGVLFKTDAKGEENEVVIGGWLCCDGRSTKEAPWFSISLSEVEAPWLFARGHASRTIASSELLATLVAVFLFIPVASGNEETLPSRGTIKCQGLTDNAGNAFVVSKLMTTKFPLSAVLMQLSTMLSERNLWLDLTWVRREENTEADALTNSDFALFSLERRVHVEWKDLPFQVLEALVKLGSEFVQEIDKFKEAKKRCSGLPPLRKRRKVLTPWG